jgi:flavin-dependent dehydrogenase
MFEERTEVNNDFELKSGSKVCVIGGGPSGSFFSYFFLELAERLGVDIELDIIELKNFLTLGPVGCNHCGGIISESLVQLLSAEGIVLPSSVVRRGIDSYVMHTDESFVKIDTPLQEKRIASVFRGSGPRGSKTTQWNSFDKYLQDLCSEKGANLIFDKVVDIKYFNDHMTVLTKNKFEKEYDLVVAAIGLSNISFNLLKGVNIKFQPPATTRTYICEYFLGEELISQYFGDSMHVFLMDIPNLEFGALIPKGQYVTLVLLGKEIDKNLVQSFLKSQQVKNCFPKEWELDKIASCQCFPRINTHTAKYMYGDRFVAIGDSATSKLFKNGIGAAYITAKAAATTALFNGVSAKNFEKYYLPTCRSLHFDNLIGKIVFLITNIIKKNKFLKKGIIKMVTKEKIKIGEKRYMSTVLWDIFTGSAPYREIFLRSLKPVFLLSLLWNTIASIIDLGTKVIMNKKNMKGSASLHREGI